MDIDLKKILPIGRTDKYLMMLGDFKFEVLKNAYETAKRDSNYRWVEKKRLLGYSKLQYNGIDSETMELSGNIYMEIAKNTGQQSYEQLSEMARSGKPYSLVNSSGKSLGMWVILSLSWDFSNITVNTVAKKTSFKIVLKNYTI
jgi:phage protein U